MTDRPYQQRAAAWLADRSKGILAADPGLGKTRIALLAAQYRGVRRLAVVCPAAVRTHWRREHEAVNPTFELVTESYARIVVNLEARRNVLAADALVLDELHFLRTISSGRTERLYETKRGIAHRFGTVWGLSGTPMPRNPLDLYPYLRAQWPNLLESFGITSLGVYRDRFTVWRATPYGIKVTGVLNLPELRRLLEPVLYRIRTEDAAPDLPELRFDVATVVLPQFDLGAIAAIVPYTFTGYGDPLPAVARLWHRVGEAKAAASVELVREYLDAGEPDGRPPKVVVFAHHRSVIDTLRRHLEPQFPVEVIDGSVPPADRDTIVARMQRPDGPQVLVAQTVAAGTGMDGLQHVTHRAFLVEPEWESHLNVQAAHRLARIGQTRPVQVTMVAAADTIDEAVTRQYWREANMREEVVG